MPAPAGSKGPIQPSLFRRPDREIEIAKRLWQGDLTPREAEEELRHHPAALDTLSVETNMVCPLRCEYCYLNDRPATTSASLDQVAGLLRQAADAGVRRFAFVGKEPLADQRAISLLGLLDARNDRSRLQLGLVTNGIFAERHVDRLSELRLDYLDVSVDGLALQNDVYRGRGSFDKAREAIRLFCQLPNSALVVNSVLHRGNIGELHAFLDAMQDVGARHFSFAPVLDLTDSEAIAGMSLEPQKLFGPVWESLESYARTSRTCQIMLDLSLGWTALALQKGRIRLDTVARDARGVTYVKPQSGLPFFVKVQILPQDTWHWARLTHDGYYLGRLRSTATREYALGAAGDLIHVTFEQLFFRSLDERGWLAEEWERSVTWASRVDLPISPIAVPS